jgi:hypothetical protein
MANVRSSKIPSIWLCTATKVEIHQKLSKPGKKSKVSKITVDYF